MSWLDPFIVFVKNGLELPKRRTVVLGDGLTATDDPGSDALTLAVSTSGGASQYPFNLQNGVAQSALASSSNKLLMGAVPLTVGVVPNQTGKVRHVYFEAIIETSNAAQSANVDIVDVATGLAVASSTLTTTALTPTLVSVDVAALTAADGALYQARLWMGAQDPAQVVTCLYAALIVKLV